MYIRVIMYIDICLGICFKLMVIYFL